MKCPKCKSEDVKVQIVSEEVVRTYKHSLFYRLLIGWWLKPIIWICTLPFRMIGNALTELRQIFQHRAQNHGCVPALWTHMESSIIDK